MSKKEPGIQRPVLDRSVKVLDPVFKNVYDNLYHLKDRVDSHSAALEEASKKAGSQTSPSEPSGVYTPILFNVTNLDASTPYPTQWMRVGNVVTVSGRVDVDPTAVVATKLGMSLPVKTNFQFGYQLGGTAACPTIAGEVAPMAADTGNNRVDMSWVTTNATNHVMSFSFTYLVN